MKKVFALLLAALMVMTAVAAFADDGVFTGESSGYNGPITAEVTIEGGKIVALTLTGDGETPAIGGEALKTLTDAIVGAGTIDGVDAVTGASWTSAGVFGAIKNALGIEEEVAETEAVSATASALRHGLGVVVTPRLGPGKDDQDVPVYSFNVVVSYVVADAEDRIVDLETDILEIITPNHDGAEDNVLAGWPGATYNNDSDGDGKVDGIFEQTTENFSADLVNWKTKRGLGDGYKMNSGTWTSEMDAFEAFFKGKTAAELQDFFARQCSDANGRVIRATATSEEDLAKWNVLTEDEQASVDALSGATMSLSDAHGDILGAIVKALDNLQPIDAADVASLGLGVVVTPRLGPGKDDQDVPVYSFNVVVAGTLLDAAEKIVAAREDILEIITPNHDGVNDNVFVGWPGQSYNSDNDGDGKVDGVAEQTPETFTAILKAFRTKRDLGDLYKMNSGTWESEMDAFEDFFKGQSIDELLDFFARQCSDSNGRIIRSTSTNEADLAKWNELTADEQAIVDTLTGATMSLSDAHGDILGALAAAVKNAKQSEIIVADTYTSASNTKTVLNGDALKDAEAELVAKSSLLSTANEAKAEGYQPKEGTVTAQIMSINTDGSVGLSTISEWKYEDGKAYVKLTHGQNALNLAEVGKTGTLLVKGDAAVYLLHLTTEAVDVLEYSEETAGNFDQFYSGAANALNEYDITFNVNAIEQSFALIF